MAADSAMPAWTISSVFSGLSCKPAKAATAMKPCQVDFSFKRASILFIGCLLFINLRSEGKSLHCGTPQRQQAPKVYLPCTNLSKMLLENPTFSKRWSTRIMDSSRFGLRLRLHPCKLSWTFRWSRKQRLSISYLLC